MTYSTYQGLEAGRLIVEKAPLNVSGCVSSVSEIWRSAAEKKGLSFVVNIEECDSFFVTDERLLRQVISNLLSNAIKFCSEGSVSVDFATVAEGGFSIAVSDTGIGIAPEKQSEVFEAFKQADGRLQRNYGGAGLGLAIVKKIAQELGGDVTLESAPDAGSKFTVTLNAERVTSQTTNARVDDNTVQDAVAVDDQSGSLKDLNVLIAEDNPTNAMVIRAYLKDRVKSVTIVENGALAVEAVKDGDFDLVLMDKQMPVMDGVAATIAIRALPDVVADIPIIAVTADAFEGAREHVIESGMDEFISKPLDAAVLTETIVSAMSKVSRKAA